MDTTARNTRMRRAVQDVARRYQISRDGENTSDRLQFSVKGGEKAYTVTASRDWSARATCTCPDAAKLSADLACKHVMAVLLAEPELQCQCLDFYL